MADREPVQAEEASRRCWAAPAALLAGLALLTLLWTLLDVVHLYAQLCAAAAPFFALVCGYLLLALGFRHSWTPTGIYVTFCGSVVGEAVGLFLSAQVNARIDAQVSVAARAPLQ